MDKFLYKIKGTKTNIDGSQEIVILYYETTGFNKAIVKAKKLLSHIHEIVQIRGEVIEDE